MAKKESKGIKKAITALVLLVLSIGILWLVQRLLIQKYQVGVVEGSFTEEYYKDNVPHDILFFGDCDVYENFSPIKMYEDYGISSYIRGSGEQYMWQSYYLLRDSLRVETPKVVVVSVHSMQNEYPKRKDNYNRMTLDGMRWSKDKVDAINVSMTEEETFASYVFPILRYHDRWNQLTMTDIRHLFSKDKISHNGYYMRCDIRGMDTIWRTPGRISYEFDQTSMYYLDQIRQLCAEKGIELILVRAPLEYGWHEQWDENIEKYASEYGLTYLNFNKYADEMGIDLTHDTYDEGIHLNIYGAEKLSVFFGKYLKEHYELTDYRTVPDVAKDYEKDIEFYNFMRDDQLRELKEYGELMSYGANAIEN